LTQRLSNPPQHDGKILITLDRSASAVPFAGIVPKNSESGFRHPKYQNSTLVRMIGTI
jgi:hypothetical protein